MRPRSTWKNGGTIFPRGGGRHGEPRAAMRRAHADAGRARRLPPASSGAHCRRVHEHADGAGRWWPVVFAGARQDGGAVGGSGSRSGSGMRSNSGLASLSIG